MSFTPRYGSALLGESQIGAREARDLALLDRRRLTCVDCRGRVVPVRRNGNFFIRHFRGVSCISSNSSAGESSTHKSAKWALAQLLQGFASRSQAAVLALRCPSCLTPNHLQHSLRLDAKDAVVLEHLIPQTPFTADVAVLRSGTPIAFFEVWSTHQVSDRKWSRLLKLGAECFELDAAAILKGSDELCSRRSSLSPPPCDDCAAGDSHLLPSAHCTAALGESAAPSASPITKTPLFTFAGPGERDDLISPPPRPQLSIAKVVEWEFVGERCYYRVRDPESYSDGMVRVGSEKEMRELCAARGWVVSETPSVIRRPTAQRRRVARHWSDRDD